MISILWRYLKASVAWVIQSSIWLSVNRFIWPLFIWYSILSKSPFYIFIVEQISKREKNEAERSDQLPRNIQWLYKYNLYIRLYLHNRNDRNTLLCFDGLFLGEECTRLRFDYYRSLFLSFSWPC